MEYFTNPNRWEYKARIAGKYTIIKTVVGTGLVYEEKTVSANTNITTSDFGPPTIVFI